jgi:hypothetical protein
MYATLIQASIALIRTQREQSLRIASQTASVLLAQLGTVLLLINPQDPFGMLSIQILKQDLLDVTQWSAALGMSQG